MHELESTADHIADASRADLQIMLRRAALLLRNVGGISLDANTDDALTSLAAEMDTPKPDLVETIAGDWLVANSYLPVPHAVDEESEVEGSA
ncbi:hypothetical protein [Mesorhizobium sp.]|uniref:hypothetical protein n=1 Tax=Mesorhizobium sp. TaxID=1871066 RepID=UPI000FE63951|nr:hypothetical protein [Mesorhizobium sp.]RWB66600.1 MAG: hypothetical protein EOQ49_28345 [Mesorhizobium sp.]RWB83309.1 MAG: hypothetical protein EOQ52_26990 [Mesorhizobium sp.]